MAAAVTIEKGKASFAGCEVLEAADAHTEPETGKGDVKGVERLIKGRRIICPFCGQPSSSLDHCTRCNALFDKQVRSIAFTEDADPRVDSIGPVSTRVGKYLMWAAIAVLLIAFAVATNWAAGYL